MVLNEGGSRSELGTMTILVGFESGWNELATSQVNHAFPTLSSFEVENNGVEASTKLHSCDHDRHLCCCLEASIGLILTDWSCTA